MIIVLNSEIVTKDKQTIKIGLTKYKDTGAGFLLEETDYAEEKIVGVVGYCIKYNKYPNMLLLEHCTRRSSLAGK